MSPDAAGLLPTHQCIGIKVVVGGAGNCEGAVYVVHTSRSSHQSPHDCSCALSQRAKLARKAAEDWDSDKHHHDIVSNFVVCCAELACKFAGPRDSINGRDVKPGPRNRAALLSDRHGLGSARSFGPVL